MSFSTVPGALRAHVIRRRWRILPLFLLIAFATNAQQVSESVPGADIASIRSWLLLHNLDLQAQQAETEAAQAQITAAGSLPNPSASITLRPGSGGSTSYQFRQPIPLWGKRTLARDIATRQADALSAGRQANALTLLAQAESAYVRYWHAQQALQLLDSQLVLLQKVEEIAGVRYALGMAPQQDAIRAQVETTRVQGQRISQQDAGSEAAILLNLLLGRSPDAPLQTPAEAPQLTVASTSLNDALATLEQNAHPALQAAQAQAQAAQDTLRLRQRERWPDISLGVGAMQSGGRFDNPDLMLEIELPLQRRALHAREREAQHLQDAALLRVEAQRTSLKGQLGIAWTQWKSAQRQRALLGQTRIPQAEANFQSALSSYQVGEVDFNALLEALTQWQDAKLARLDAQRDELLGAVNVRTFEGETP